MKARGERIVIVGDSLSHPGSDSGPTQSVVTATSARRSSAPGDLLASLLLEQGAEAVMLDAKVSRSAYNYWSREPTAKLMAEIAKFAPTKVVVMLGTNDIGLSVDADKTAFEALRDAFKNMGAEVWAVGPFTYVGRGASLNPGAEGVFTMMEGVFGASNTLDGRPLSVNTDRSSDGIHFTPSSAEGTANNIAAALLSKNPLLTSSTWLAIGAGIAGALGIWGIIAYNRGRTRSLGELPPAPDEDIEDIADDADTEGNYEEALETRKQLSTEGKRKLRSEGYAELYSQAERDWSNSDGLDPELTPREALRKLIDEVEDGVDAWVEQNREVIDQHLLDEHKAFSAWRDSFVTRARASAQRLEQGGLTALRERRYAPDPKLLEGNPWIIDAVSRERPELRGADLSGAALRGPSMTDYVEAQDAGREIAQRRWDSLNPAHPSRRVEPQTAAIAHDALIEGRNEDALTLLEISEPPPWDGDDSPGVNATYLSSFFERLKSLTQEAAGLTPSFHKLVRDLEPDSMDIAEELALEKGWKISQMAGGRRHGHIDMSEPGAPRDQLREVAWHTPEPHRQHDPSNQREVNVEVLLGKHRIERKSVVGTSRDKYASRVGAANAWAIAKAIKTLPLDVDKKTLEKAIDKALDQDTMVPEELFGAKPKRTKLTRDDVVGAVADTLGASEPSWFDPQEDLQSDSGKLWVKRNQFFELLRDPDPDSVIAAEDLALQNGIKLRTFGADSSAKIATRGSFGLGPIDRADAPVTRVTWAVEPGSRVNSVEERERTGNLLRAIHLETELNVMINNVEVWPRKMAHPAWMRESSTVKTFPVKPTKTQSVSPASWNKAAHAATADAWAIVKYLKSGAMNISEEALKNPDGTPSAAAIEISKNIDAILKEKNDTNKALFGA